MLFDPKWEVETMADPFQLGTLIAWLEKQPANEAYCFFRTGHCLLATYFQQHGYPKTVAGGDYVRLEGRGQAKSPVGQAFEMIAAAMPYTYGAALQRARGYSAS